MIALAFGEGNDFGDLVVEGADGQVDDDGVDDIGGDDAGDVIDRAEHLLRGDVDDLVVGEADDVEAEELLDVEEVGEFRGPTVGADDEHVADVFLAGVNEAKNKRMVNFKIGSNRKARTR